MPAKKDLTGQTFGRLFVIGQDMEKYAEKHEVFWKCRCICGNFKSVRTYDLTHGKTLSCGCLRNERIREAVGNKLEGKKFGKLTVLEQVESIREDSGMLRTAWKCQCDCGNIVIVKTLNLNSGDTTSCGCSHSKGETKIEKILRENNVKYSQQYVFSELVSLNGGKLKFDFAVFNDDNSLRYLIEFNGVQHYKPIDFFGGEKQLEIQKQNDQLKISYCKQNKIPLVIISYQEIKDINFDYIERQAKQYEKVYGYSEK